MRVARVLPLLLLFVLASASAQQEEKKTFEQRALETGDKISEKIGKTAEKLDITLAGKKYTKKPNPSRLEIRQLVTYSEGGRLKVSTDFGLNLRLPNLEKRWQLRFTSYDEERESHDINQQRVRTRPRERNYGAGFLFFEKLGKIKTSFLPRLQLKNPLEVSYLLRFESDSEWQPVRVTPRVDLFADPNKGTGEFASLEFRTDATYNLEISLLNSEEYRARENFFNTQHGLTFDYALTDTEAVGFAVTTSSINRPAFHLDTVTYSTAYTQQIYPDRLTYTVTPFLLFAKSKHFKGDAGISLTVDLTL